jgi:hypothetical protein
MFESTQEKLTGVFSLGLAFVVMLYYMIQGQVAFSLVYLVIAGIAAALNVYTIGCILRGNCNFYSWFLTIMTVVYGIIGIIMYSSMIAHNEGIITVT